MDPSRTIKHNDADASSSSGSWDAILAEVSSVFAGFILFPHLKTVLHAETGYQITLFI